MADLAADRGQLFLVGAFALALLLVVLALVLNSVVYTGTVATADGNAGDERAAAAYHHTTVTEVQAIIDRLNRENNTSHRSLYGNLSTEVARIDELFGRQYAADGASVNTTLLGATNETRIGQDTTTRNFTNRSRAANWTVVASTPAVEHFRMNVSRDRLYAVDNESCVATGNCFTVVVENDTDRWRLFVNTSVNGSEITVTVVDPAGRSDRCSVDAASARLNVTEGSLAGTDCAAINVTADADPPYEVTYRRGDRVAGTYDLLVLGAVPEDPHFDTDGPPSASPRLAAATVRLSYRTPTLHFETQERIERGVIDD